MNAHLGQGRSAFEMEIAHREVAIGGHSGK
jgi:hypothetical protein